MITPNLTELDLGQVPLGEAKNFEITVSNSYNKTLAVGVAFGCGACTNGGFYPDNNIAPGGSRQLKVKFTPTSKGAQVKSIRLNHLPPGATKTIATTIKFKAEVI